MVVLLDTSTHASADRTEAFRQAMASAGIPAVAIPRENQPVHAVLEAWPLGSTHTLLRRHSSGIRLVRTARAARSTPVERIAVTLLSPGAWRFSQSRSEHASGAESGTVILVDHSSPYDFNRYDDGSTVALNIDVGALELPRDTVVAAVREFTSRHPMHDLMSCYLRLLVDRADRDPAGLKRSAWAAPQLARALIAEAAGDTNRAREAYRDCLLARLQIYVAVHATDPTIAPEQIARAHHISVRHLYKTWQRTGETLGQAIIRERLVAAQRRLRNPSMQSITIAAVGRACGFVDPTHFTHRFTEMFGMSPRAWKAGPAQQADSSSPSRRAPFRP